MSEVAPDHITDQSEEAGAVLPASVQVAEDTRNQALRVVDTDYENELALKSSPEYKSAMAKLLKAGNQGVHYSKLATYFTPEELRVINMEAEITFPTDGITFVHPDFIARRKPLPPEAALSKRPDKAV